MNEALTKALKKDFPNLFKQIYSFDCQDGWEKLIRELSEKLEPKGVKAVQVKEKFGGLRFYIDYPLPDLLEEMDFSKIENLIREAEQESYKICEFCGSKENVKLRGKFWVVSLCESCENGKQRI